MIRKLFYIIFITLFCSNLFSQITRNEITEKYIKENIAVFEIQDVSTGYSKDLGNKVTTLIENALTRMKRFNIVDRKNLDKYLDIMSKDSILTKLKDSKNLIVSNLEFQGKFSGELLIKNTHIVVVYNGKNNKPVNNTNLKHILKQQVSHNSKGKQNRAINLNTHTKNKDSKFSLEVKKLGYTSCLENDFSVPAKPQAEKLKGVGKIRYFSIFSAQDFKKLVELKSQNDDCVYLQDWDWGEYCEYMKNK